MKEVYRKLTPKDLDSYKIMETHLERDYVKEIFPLLTRGDNHLFGLFLNEKLIAVAGYVLIANKYAMLGRLRSDARFRGRSYGMKILNYAKEQASLNSKVEWIGGNTEENNPAAQKVLNKVNIPYILSLYGARTKSLDNLTNGSQTWNLISSVDKKRQWLEKTYLNFSFGEDIFPYQAYFPLPASKELFTDKTLDSWTFYENEGQTRYLILWEEELDLPYLHVTYPWKDCFDQDGLWETVSLTFEKLKSEDPEVHIWKDLIKSEVEDLPENHPFRLDSAWMLHGKWLSQDDKELSGLSADHSKAMKEAKTQMNYVEQELFDLQSELEKRENALKEIKKNLEDLNS